MHSIEDVSAAGSQGLNVPPDVVLDFFRRAHWQETLGIYPSAPEHQRVAEIALQCNRLHPIGADMHWIENLHANLNEIGYQWPHAATRVKEPPRVRSQFLDTVKQYLQAWFELLPEHARRDKL